MRAGVDDVDRASKHTICLVKSVRIPIRQCFPVSRYLGHSILVRILVRYTIVRACAEAQVVKQEVT